MKSKKSPKVRKSERPEDSLKSEVGSPKLGRQKEVKGERLKAKGKNAAQFDAIENNSAIPIK